MNKSVASKEKALIRKQFYDHRFWYQCASTGKSMVLNPKLNMMGQQLNSKFIKLVIGKFIY